MDPLGGAHLGAGVAVGHDDRAVGRRNGTDPDARADGDHPVVACHLHADLVTGLHAEHPQAGAEERRALQQPCEREGRRGRVVRAPADDVPVEQVEPEARHHRPRNTGVRFSVRAVAASRTSSLAQTSRNPCSMVASSSRSLRTRLL